MHVLLIHQAFASATDPGGTRHFELSRHLAARGHRVTIIASQVSYLTGKADETRYDRLAQHETIDGIDIRRIPVYAPSTGGFFDRVRGFLSFMVAAFFEAVWVSDVDVVWGTTPPIFQACSAYLAARVKRTRFVLEVRDLWPDFAIQMGVLENPVLIALSRQLERFLYRHADRIIVNSPGFLPHLKRQGVPATKVGLIPNGVDLEMFDRIEDGAALRTELGLEGKFIALYAGAHGLANDLDTLLEAAKRLLPHKDIVVVLVGDGREKKRLVDKAEREGISNVRFIPAQPKLRMPAVLQSADVCVAILKAAPMFDTTYPNKVFDYMAAGRPTVLAIDGVIRDVIEAADGGTFVPPGEPSALAEAILRYHQEPALGEGQGQRARAYVAAHFDRREQAERLRLDLERLSSRTP